MTCKCISYNRPQPWQTEPERVMERPSWMTNHDARPTICVDACIADAVQALWDARIWTIGSCCGHGDPSMRGVIVDRADREPARRVLDQIDPSIRVGAWVLVFDDAAPPPDKGD